MSEIRITVRELESYLQHLIENGHGDKIVRVSVVYGNCEHIQDLKNVYPFEGIDWITLTGG